MRSNVPDKQRPALFERMNITHLLWALILGSLFLRVVSVFFAPINQDEGWYLLASRNFSEGLIPYQDFSFTQGPVFLWVYGKTFSMWHSVTGGRVFTAILGLSILLPAGWIGSRLTAPSNRTACWCMVTTLVGWNLFQAEYSSIVKTYALAGVLFSSAAAALLKATFVEGKSAIWWALAAGLLAGASAGVRISLGAAIPMVLIYLLLNRRQFTSSIWFLFSAGAALMLLFVFGWAWSYGGTAWMDNQIGYHVSREGFELFGKLVGIGGHLSRLLGNYASAAVLAVCLILLRSAGSATRRERNHRSGLLVAMLAGPFLVHLGAPFPYDDYQSPLYPVFCSWLAGAAFNTLHQIKYRNHLLLFVVCISVLFVVASPVIQRWFVLRKDTISWDLRTRPALVDFRAVCTEINNTVGQDPLWTMDASIPVEIGSPVSTRLTMGVFSFFPEATIEKSDRLHVLSLADPTGGADFSKTNWLLLSDWTFAVAGPGATRFPEDERIKLIDGLTESFEKVQSWSDFGQDAGSLSLWRRTSPANELGPSQ